MYSLGCFVDVFTFLEHVRTGHNGDESGTLNLNKLEKLKKLNLSPADATVLVAHSNLVPGIFGRSTGEINATKTHLPALSKYTDFDVGDNMSGLKYIISVVRCNRLRKASKEMIADQLAGSSTAIALALFCLKSSVLFLTALLHFITTTYETLHEKSGFPRNRAWALVSKLVYRIFADMNKVRGGVKVASKTNDPRSLCSVVLYPVLRTMDVQQGYLRHNISDHPSISSEYVKFLATNSGLQKVGLLEANVAKVQIEVRTLKLDVAKASKVADLASNKANEALLAAKKCQKPP
eukprot:scaffold26488_cov57-Attheya_sp.AAC.4